MPQAAQDGGLGTQAREGEVGWKYEVVGPEGRSRSVRSVIGPKPNVAAPVGGYVVYDALYTHPAAPSADKLRIAVEASGFLLDRLSDLEQDVNERDFYGHVHPAASRLRQALAALKAGGAK